MKIILPLIFRAQNLGNINSSPPNVPIHRRIFIDRVKYGVASNIRLISFQ